MPNKYKAIRDYHEIEMIKELDRLRRNQKALERRIYLIGLLLLVFSIFLLYWFFES